MLTATYTLVALSVEQASIRANLQSLQKLLQANFRHQTVLGAAQVGYASEVLQRLYHNGHWRKVDLFLIPAVRRVTRQADGLLAELEVLSALAGEAIGAVAARVGQAALDSEAAVAQFCATIDIFCDAMLARLEREETELFAIARSVISGETWFAIANHMLAQDAQRAERRPAPDAALPGRAAAAEPPRRQGAPVLFAA